MIERSPFFDFVTYLAMAFGAFVVVIPFWITLVAGSQSLQEVSQVPISLLPSSHLFENLQAAWGRGDLGPKMINSFIVATLTPGIANRGLHIDIFVFEARPEHGSGRRGTQVGHRAEDFATNHRVLFRGQLFGELQGRLLLLFRRHLGGSFGDGM